MTSSSLVYPSETKFLPLACGLSAPLILFAASAVGRADEGVTDSVRGGPERVTLFHGGTGKFL
jgi:hypothetical protein